MTDQVRVIERTQNVLRFSNNRRFCFCKFIVRRPMKNVDFCIIWLFLYILELLLHVAAAADSVVSVQRDELTIPNNCRGNCNNFHFG